jgi:hypothetical protein
MKFKKGNISKIAWYEVRPSREVSVFRCSPKCRRHSSGRYHTALFTEAGKIYEMASGQSESPEWNEVHLPSTSLLGKPPVVRSLVCGGFRTMALCEDGSVWRWGSNAGRGKPERIPGLEGKVIVKISCGLYECLALTGA